MATLNALLIVGVIVNLIKGADLILRPHQQRKVQAFFEDVTLRLEALRPVEWLSLLTSPRGQINLLLVGIGEFVLVLLATVGSAVWRGEFTLLGNTGATMNSLAVLLSLATLPLVPRLGGPALMSWLLKDVRAFSFLRRFVLLILAGFTVLAIYQAALWGAAYLVDSQDPFDAMEQPLNQAGLGTLIVSGGLLIAWPPFVYFWILTQVGGLVLWLSLLARIAEILLKGLRGIAWRVVEYNKGAWAALVLLLTIALGFVKIALTGSA